MKRLLVPALTIALLVDVVGGHAFASHLGNSIASVFDDGQGNTLPYHLFIPPEMESQREDVPLVLFLHGAGERGTDNSAQVDVHIGGLLGAAQGLKYPSYVLAPQVPLGSNWSQQRDATMKLLADVQENYNIDSQRIYVTGLSMGGFGTFDFVATAPERFAAAVPMSGGWDPVDAPLMKDVPMWIFHGENDSVVPVELSRNMNQAIVTSGGFPRYTEIAGGGHSIWSPIYWDRDDRLYPWLFNQSTAKDAKTLTPNAIYTVRDDDRDDLFDDLGDDSQDASEKERRSLGEFDGENANQIVRVVAKFELPPQEAGKIARATLRFFVDLVDGTPAGPLSLRHSLSDNDLGSDPSDFEDASYADTLLDFLGPTDPAGQFYDLDVTQFVLADYDAERAAPVSAFRLQIDETVFFEDNQSARYRIGMPGSATNGPQLILTLVPEPASVMLAVCGLLIFLIPSRWAWGTRPAV